MFLRLSVCGALNEETLHGVDCDWSFVVLEGEKEEIKQKAHSLVDSLLDNLEKISSMGQDVFVLIGGSTDGFEE